MIDLIESGLWWFGRHGLGLVILVAVFAGFVAAYRSLRAERNTVVSTHPSSLPPASDRRMTMSVMKGLVARHGFEIRENRAVPIGKMIYIPPQSPGSELGVPVLIVNPDTFRKESP